MAEQNRQDTSILLSGEAGQGIQTIQKLLAHLLRKQGYHVFATKEYMSRIRGGVNTTQLRVGNKRIHSSCSAVDVFVPLTPDTTQHLNRRLDADTIILGEKEKIGFGNMTDIPFTEVAREVGNKLYVNTVAVGLLAGIFEVEDRFLQEAIKEHFHGKSDRIVQDNINAAQRGYQLAQENTLPQISPPLPHLPESELLINGGQAVALGAVAGNCSLACSYPMSPSTAVLTNLAEYSQTADILVEQTEDEIAAINMALGAWYAGGKSLITTSGGGFSLMSEGVSLAGMIESPLVVHLAQRPGPATGLPTRTEQGDLNLALYGGHGEFPRIIFSPGDVTEAFYLTQKAFNLADRLQVPVIILTDQFLVDSFYNVPMFELDHLQNEDHTVAAEADYKRYTYTNSGISPRAVPGTGPGFVNVDSDEHDEGGYITEDLAQTRPSMNEKRAVLKAFTVQEHVIPPIYIGPPSPSVLAIGWGSTKTPLLEAVNRLNRPGVAALHFSQPYPLPRDIGDYLSNPERLLVVEQNIDGQFAELLERKTGRIVEDKILKTTGEPFFADDLAQQLADALEY